MLSMAPSGIELRSAQGSTEDGRPLTVDEGELAVAFTSDRCGSSFVSMYSMEQVLHD